MSIAWQKSRIRPDRFTAEYGGAKLVIQRKRSQWLLTRNGEKIAGTDTRGRDELLRDIADGIYTHGLDRNEALAAAQRAWAARRK